MSFWRSVVNWFKYDPRNSVRPSHPVFPLLAMPDLNWHGAGCGSRGFGSARAAGRTHAGVDLCTAAGSVVLAMEAGIVRRAAYVFYRDTCALEIIGRNGLLYRYCELENDAELMEWKPGSNISKGQVIGVVGDLGEGSGMLHLEVYNDAARPGRLTDHNNPPSKRRPDLIDPTSHLLASRYQS